MLHSHANDDESCSRLILTGQELAGKVVVHMGVTTNTTIRASPTAFNYVKPKHLFFVIVAAALVLSMVLVVVALGSIRSQLAREPSADGMDDARVLSVLQALMPNETKSNGAVCVSMMGGFGNQLYILFTAVMYSVKHNLTLYLASQSWRRFSMSLFPVLQRFEAPCPNSTTVSVSYTNSLRWKPGPADNGWYNKDPRTMTNATDFHVSLREYFQYSTALYAPYENEIRSMLQPDPRLSSLLMAVRHHMLQRFCGDSLLIGIHVRRGDYAGAMNDSKNPFKLIPTTLFFQWLDRLQHSDLNRTLAKAKQLQDADCQARLSPIFTVSDVVLLVLSEDSTMAQQFRAAGYTVIGSSDILESFFAPWVSLRGTVSEWYADWWLLSQMRVIATSHSTYSLTATILSPYSRRPQREELRAGFYFRPDQTTMSLVQFEPWDFWYNYRAFLGDE